MYLSGSQNLEAGPNQLAFPRNLLEMQILGQNLRPTISESRLQLSTFTSPAVDSDAC